MKVEALGEVLDRLDALREDESIFARKPWTVDSACVLAPLASNGAAPPELPAQGYQYFLEVTSAREAICGAAEMGFSASQIRDILIYYAENDAYPPWTNGA